jgi:16S rRNA (guanine527-N7)-methyltransferase
MNGAEELGLGLTPEQTEKFQCYYQELTAWNRRMNLTAIVDYHEVQVKHFLDSLTTSMVLSGEVRDQGRIMDIGAGGGFPGIPLKIAFPGIHLVMLDSVGKKTGFLNHLIEALELTDTDVYTGRAEDLAIRPELREGFDVVVSRGVARMRILMELTLPFCRVGGNVVTLKKGDLGSEVAHSLHAMEVLGGKIREARGVDVEGLRDDRVLLVVDKIKPTPSKFPRRPGLPTKHPL